MKQSRNYLTILSIVCFFSVRISAEVDWDGLITRYTSVSIRSDCKAQVEKVITDLGAASTACAVAMGAVTAADCPSQAEVLECNKLMPQVVVALAENKCMCDIPSSDFSLSGQVCDDDPANYYSKEYNDAVAEECGPLGMQLEADDQCKVLVDEMETAIMKSKDCLAVYDEIWSAEEPSECPEDNSIQACISVIQDLVFEFGEKQCNCDDVYVDLYRERIENFKPSPANEPSIRPAAATREVGPLAPSTAPTEPPSSAPTPSLAPATPPDFGPTRGIGPSAFDASAPGFVLPEGPAVAPGIALAPEQDAAGTEEALAPAIPTLVTFPNGTTQVNLVLDVVTDENGSSLLILPNGTAVQVFPGVAGPAAANVSEAPAIAPASALPKLQLTGSTVGVVGGSKQTNITEILEAAAAPAVSPPGRRLQQEYDFSTPCVNFKNPASTALKTLQASEVAKNCFSPLTGPATDDITGRDFSVPGLAPGPPPEETDPPAPAPVDDLDTAAPPSVNSQSFDGSSQSSSERVKPFEPPETDTGVEKSDNNAAGRLYTLCSTGIALGVGLVFLL